MSAGVKLGGTWHHLNRCGSTNDEALALGRAGAPEGTVVTADSQERGRGRLGRTWFSPPGENLYLSVLLRPELAAPRTPFLTLCAGVALAEAATRMLAQAMPEPIAPGAHAQTGRAPPVAQLKWPNDLLLGRRGDTLRKAGGILTELVCSGGRVDFVVIGIGVNVNCLDFPDELLATSLRAVLPSGGAALSVSGFATLLLSQLQERYEDFLARGPEPIRLAFAAHAAYLGQPAPITVNCGDRLLRGTPVGLAEDGALLLRGESGELHRVVAGQITSPLPT